MLSLNLSGGLGCSCSTRIDNDADDTCDVPTDCLDALPNIDIPPLDPALISGVRFEINIGEDLDDLPLGCSHEDNATLSFTDGEDNWVLRWGAYDSFGGAGHRPDSEFDHGHAGHRRYVVVRDHGCPTGLSVPRGGSSRYSK